MYEYRLAFEFWGSLVLATVVLPLFMAGLRHVRELLQDVRDDGCSGPLSSVPSTPRPG
ncbi:MAG TPA: hypothetical protein VHU80_01205 [Polyangiaceae bacterium]|jgi:hypothetical protein|nr:hypothetical protein [Polyangiaceae bacterium]